MTDDATGPDDDELPEDDQAGAADGPTDEHDTHDDDGTGGDGRSHPWAPYERDDADHAEEFDAPTKDVRAGLDYDATRRREDPEELREEIEDLKERLASFESDVEQRTLPRDEVERELQRYVRWRMRRGHARGWGPYLVLLNGTIMTLGAFWELQGAPAIAAMIVIWLSTLGLYVFMIVVGIGLEVLSLPWKYRDRISEWRS